ncbi:hypothetical protein, partial [Flavobacterium selenitireducens]|uniref:hypothetical protein n=1 Tax=Flavobacterium selenitireducens TaxID=2722704 RepID=UPI001CC2827F
FCWVFCGSASLRRWPFFCRGLNDFWIRLVCFAAPLRCAAGILLPRMREFFADFLLGVLRLRFAAPLAQIYYLSVLPKLGNALWISARFFPLSMR